MLPQIKISKAGIIKLNSFLPLCYTELGIEAIAKYNLPPFIDALCRREPDFDNPFPSITALCRQGQFAPHLKENDLVVYMTVGGHVKPFKKGHHLVAILQVEEVYSDHTLAKEAYLNAGLQIPSNCMVEDNLAVDFDKTAGNFKRKSQLKTFMSDTIQAQELEGQNRIKFWDKQYMKKSLIWKSFVKTKAIYVNTKNPPVIESDDFDFIFGKLPNTRSPKIINKEQLIGLAKIAGLDLVFS
jgi:hypothetical protein